HFDGPRTKRASGAWTLHGRGLGALLAGALEDHRHSSGFRDFALSVTSLALNDRCSVADRASLGSGCLACNARAVRLALALALAGSARLAAAAKANAAPVLHAGQPLANA